MTGYGTIEMALQDRKDGAAWSGEKCGSGSWTLNEFMSYFILNFADLS